MRVLRVNASETYPSILETHYAHRIPNILFAFGLFDGAFPIGYVTYGNPASAPLREGLVGPDNAHLVLELNRLVMLREVKNGASMLVGASLQLLPHPSVVVSYADTGVGHVGYVYQACNFIYTGLSAKRTDWKLSGREGLHGQTVADMSRSASGGERGSRAKYMREKFGDDFYLAERDRKHRYVFVVGSKTDKKRLVKQIRYSQEQYPKGESKHYVARDPSVLQPQIPGL